MVEAIDGKPNGNGCSRVLYSEIAHGITNHEELSREDQVGFRAVDLMLAELTKDPAFEENFMSAHGLTLNDRERLTNPADPNYRKDILWGVHNPDDFFSTVLYCSNEILDEEKHIRNWGERLISAAMVKNEEDDDITREARGLVGSLMFKEQGHFGLDFVIGEPVATPSAS